MQLQNNVVGVNGPSGARTDMVLWYPNLSRDYFQGEASLHDGQLRWPTNRRNGRRGNRNWRQITLRSGRETLANQIAAERLERGQAAPGPNANLIGNPI